MSEEREYIKSAYETSKRRNALEFKKGCPNATEKYIFENQEEDANKILSMFYGDQTLRVVSIIKQCKVGMDGLMIQLLYLFTTHPDDTFKLPINNVKIITGMSNKEWENNLKSKMPECFVNQIYHHGKLTSKNKLPNELENIKNCLIIIDEIDTGDKQNLRLHKLLSNSCIFNKDYIIKNNIRFVMVSATMKNQLSELKKWNFDDMNHKSFKMSIPLSYASINYFLNKNIYKEYYPVNSKESALKWITDDIIDNYKNDYRIHFIRTTENKKSFIKDVSFDKDIQCFDHTSDNRIPYDELSKYFNSNLENHIIICVKGFYRRSNLIPNKWKKKIGAIHELYSKKPNIETEVQAFPGRLCGYWKEDLDNGHKIGPLRTSIDSMKEYVEWYNNPERINIGKTNTFVAPKNIGVNIPQFKNIPSIKETFNGKCLYKEEECNEARENIRNYQIDKGYIKSDNRVGKGNFNKLSSTFYDKENNLYKYSYNGSIKKLWKPEEITKDHTNLCNIRDTTKIHNIRIIERRPTYIEINGIKELRYKIFFYDGVIQIKV